MERKKQEIANARMDRSIMYSLNDDHYFWYDQNLLKYQCQAEKKKWACQFNRRKLFWQSSSQGWYYEHCHPGDFLSPLPLFIDKADFCIEYRDVYSTQNSRGDRDKKPGRGWTHEFEWYVSLRRTDDPQGDNWVTAEGYIQDITIILMREGYEVPALALSIIKKFERAYAARFLRMLEYIENEIRGCDNYYPDDEEINSYLESQEDEEYTVEETELSCEEV
jgi:hypothetical protein